MEGFLAIVGLAQGLDLSIVELAVVGGLVDHGDCLVVGFSSAVDFTVFGDVFLD